MNGRDESLKINRKEWNKTLVKEMISTNIHVVLKCNTSDETKILQLQIAAPIQSRRAREEDYHPLAELLHTNSSNTAVSQLPTQLSVMVLTCSQRSEWLD